jgi:nitroreductase
MLRDLVIKSRSYRRFDESVEISMETLRELVDLGRLSPCGRNIQSIKYILSCDREKNATIFAHLGWAMRLPEWPGPAEGQRPSAYIVIVRDTEVSEAPNCDQAIAAQSILLGATERGLGGCMLGSVQRARLQDTLDIPKRYQILLVVALGKPKETVVLEELGSDGDTAYWRDENGAHHVPKRSLDEVIVAID